MLIFSVASGATPSSRWRGRRRRRVASHCENLQDDARISCLLLFNIPFHVGRVSERLS